MLRCKGGRSWPNQTEMIEYTYDKIIIIDITPPKEVNKKGACTFIDTDIWIYGSRVCHFMMLLCLKWRYFVQLNLRMMYAVIGVFLIKSFPVCLYNSCMSVALFICVSAHKLRVHSICSIVFNSLMNLWWFMSIPRSLAANSEVKPVKQYQRKRN